MANETGTTDTQPDASNCAPQTLPAAQIGESHSACDDKTLRMRQQWEKAVCKELEIPNTYRSVGVLLVHWDSDLDSDLKCADEVNELKELFAERFKFDCEVLALNDSKKPQAQLDRAIAELILTHDGPCRSNLLIVYYTGHGRPRDEYGLDISGFRDPGIAPIGPTSHKAVANWNLVEDFLQRAEADVLVILDTCYAGNIFKGGIEDVRTFQVLAAAGRDMPTSPPGKHSFTRALIQTLNDKLDQMTENDSTPLTISDLNLAIWSRRQNMSSKFFPHSSSRSTRDIRLAPLKPPGTAFISSPGRDAAHLTIRFAFRDHATLDDEQITGLAKKVSGAVRKSKLNIRAIDFVGFKQCDSEPRLARGNLWHRPITFVLSQIRLSEYLKETQRKRAASDGSETGTPSIKRQRLNLDTTLDGFELPSPSATPGREDNSPR